MRDLMNNIHTILGLAPAVVTDNTAQVTAIINVANNKSCTFAILLGTLSDADTTLAVTMDHGNVSNLSDAASVPTDMMVGTLALAGATFADDGETRKIGYNGDKNYVRLTVTPANNTGNIPIAILAILEPYLLPTANPPQ